MFQKRAAKVNFFKSPREVQTKTVLLTKDKFWEYEQEWRIIDHETGSGVYTFPSELLTGVIIGCQMPEESKKKIETWVKNRDPQPTLYLAELKEQEFELDIIPIS